MVASGRAGLGGRIAAIVGVTGIGILGLAGTAGAETVFGPVESPLLAQGKACLGLPCGTGTTPGLMLDLMNDDTPGVRLHQAGGGFGAQTWDVAGNEANFFVRDLTNGSLLPFRIRPGAPTSSIDIAASGRVGVGTNNPAASLDVTRADGSTRLRVAESNSTVETRTLAALENNGPVRLELLDGDAEVGWAIATTAAGSVALTPVGPSALPSLVLADHGDLTVSGVLQQTADPARQTGVEAADSGTILDAVRTLPIQRYALDGDPSGAKHLSPEGAAFREALGLGADDARLAPGDVAAAALAAVQQLAADTSDREGDERIPGLIAQVTELERLTEQQAKQLTAVDKQLTAADTRATATEARATAAEAAEKALAGSVAQAERLDQRQQNRFVRTNRVLKRLKGQVASLERTKRKQATQLSELQTANASLQKRVAAIEAALARHR